MYDMIKLIFLLVLIHANFILAKYSAAVVQFKYEENGAAETVAGKIIDVIGSIKRDQKSLDLVVFPEAVLSSAEESTFVDRGISPCHENSGRYAIFFEKLSCAAGKFHTYLVVNLREKVANGTLYNYYNTDVVFDRFGRVVASYRKYHLYLEPGISRTDEPDIATFGTDFGETFGLFTCFDILFAEPPLALVSRGVKNFIYPTMWYSELPFLTAPQVQQMWSQANDAIFLASGVSHLKYGVWGAGILGRGGILKYSKPSNETNYVYYGIKDEVCRSENINDDVGRAMDKYSFYQEDLTDYAGIFLNSSLTTQLCHGSFCCDFEVKVKELKVKENAYRYALLAKSGVRTFGMGTYSLGIDVCGIVACKSDSMRDCGVRFDKYDDIDWITFESIKISGTFDKYGAKQFPNSLRADLFPLPPEMTKYLSVDHQNGVQKYFELIKPTDKLFTFAIYGRNFKLD